MTDNQQQSVTQAEIIERLQDQDHLMQRDGLTSMLNTADDAVSTITDLRAQLAEAKKQSEFRSRQWSHYEKLAKGFSSREHMARRYLQKAEAENKRLRELLEGACKGIEDGRLYDAMCCSGYECGCRGSSNADLLCHDLRAALSTPINKEPPPDEVSNFLYHSGYEGNEYAEAAVRAFLAWQKEQG